MFTETDAAAVRVLRVTGDANIGVSVTLASAANNEMGDAVVVGLKYFGIPKHFISKSVQIPQRNSKTRDILIFSYNKINDMNLISVAETQCCSS